MSAARLEARVRAELSQGLQADIARLSCLDYRARLREVSAFAAFWALGTALVVFVPRLWPLGAAGIAVACNAFLLLQHEGMHGLLSRHRGVNHWASVFFGASTLVSFTAYRVIHFRHHGFLGDPRDPDDYHNYSSNPRVVWLLHYVRLALGAFLYLLLIPLIGLRYGNRRERSRIVQEYALIAIAYSLLVWALPLELLLKAWLAPLLLMAYFTNLRGFIQHSLVDTSDPYLASRSIHAGPVVSFLLLNENYHLEHHLFPEVPSYNLGRLHRLIFPRLPRAIVNRSYAEVMLAFFKATASLDETPIGRRDLI